MAPVFLIPFAAVLAAATEPGLHPAPGGARAASVGVRDGDGWQTIWLVENGARRDLLPGDAGGRLGSPGVRAVEFGTWLNDRELAFHHRCGTGCVAIYRMDVESGAFTHVWTGAVDRGIHWSPRRDRAAVEGHLGELLLVWAAGRTARLPGCQVERGHPRGTWYAFDAWTAGGDAVRVRRIDCGCLEDPPADAGRRLLWDGKRLERP